MTDSLKFGATVSEADSYGFDLNPATPFADNSLGKFFAGVSNQIPIDASIAASIATGETVILHSLHAYSLDADATATWWVILGEPTPDPVLTGGGHFDASRSPAAHGKLKGAITDGQFTGNGGTVPLQLAIAPGREPIVVHLRDARLQAECTEDACQSGKIGGGIPGSEVNDKVIPAFAAAIQTLINESCTGPTPDSCTPNVQQLLSIFDTNGDMQVTADELRSNFLITAILAPDLDLVKKDGAPGHDGINDSLSVGLGFTAKNAVFVGP